MKTALKSSARVSLLLLVPGIGTFFIWASFDYEDAKIKFITGMNHADIENYGSNSGDNSSKLMNYSVVKLRVSSTEGFLNNYGE